MKLVPTGLTQKIGRQILNMKKNSPRTMFVAGIVGVGVSTVLACRATLKLEKTLDDFNNEVDMVKADTGLNNGEHRRDLAYVYGKNSFTIVKLYAPALLIGTASIAALTGSHVSLSRRNASLTAAYSAVSMSFDAYRDRVRQELGAEKELDVYHAATKEKMMVDGKTELVRVADPNKWSPYARFFDEGSPNFKKQAEYNRLFIQCQQNYCNDLLQARGHVFLNEVYDMLGIPRSQAGQVVGWVIGPDGDNFIDFGVFEAVSFVNGLEPRILLDFNVDGVIYNKI